MIQIWQAVVIAILAGGIGTAVGMAVMAALVMAKDADRRMGVE